MKLREWQRLVREMLGETTLSRFDAFSRAGNRTGKTTLGYERTKALVTGKKPPRARLVEVPINPEEDT